MGTIEFSFPYRIPQTTPQPSPPQPLNDAQRSSDVCIRLARAILLKSSAGDTTLVERIISTIDPADLAAWVNTQIDEAGGPQLFGETLGAWQYQYDALLKATGGSVEDAARILRETPPEQLKVWLEAQ